MCIRDRFKGNDGTEFSQTIYDFECPGVLQGLYNKDSSIEAFAHSCFNYALSTKQDLWFSAKDTISKQYDQTFKLIFQRIYDEEYKDKFEAAGITYFYTLIDDAVARVMRSEEMCIRDSSYTPYEAAWMPKENIRPYQAEIRRLQAVYSGQIRILLGIEQDYYSDEATDAYEYVIGAVHNLRRGGEYRPLDYTRDRLIATVNDWFGGDWYALEMCIRDRSWIWKTGRLGSS